MLIVCIIKMYFILKEIKDLKLKNLKILTDNILFKDKVNIMK